MRAPSGVGLAPSLPDELEVDVADVRRGNLIVYRRGSRRGLALVTYTLGRAPWALRCHTYTPGRGWSQSSRSISAGDFVGLYCDPLDHAAVVEHLTNNMPPALKAWWNEHGIPDPALAAAAPGAIAAGHAPAGGPP